MPLKYAVKHVFRSWHLFLALLLGITLASAFFAGIDTKANVTAKQALDQQLASVYKDLEITPYPFNLTQLDEIQTQLSEDKNVRGFEIMSRGQAPANVYDINSSKEVYPMVVGLTDNSRVYDGWLNKPAEGVGENETYLYANARSRSDGIKVGDVVHLNFSTYNPENGSLILIPLNLTVKGFAQFDDAASSLVVGYSIMVMPVPVPGATQISSAQFFFGSDLMIVDWEKTVKPILEVSEKGQVFQQSVLIYLDREAMISAWDVQTSINNLRVVQNDIGNKLDSALGLHVSVQNNLESALQIFMAIYFGLWVGFIVVSIPIFFMAWYMGTTVSDVSFNSRRREIGLLSTKGFSNGQISRIFLTETIFIGLVGGILGFLASFLLTPLFTQLSEGIQFNLQSISPNTAVFTVVFGLIMALLSTFSSARRAARLSTVAAIREYLPLETEKPYRKRLPWLAFILGTYKIVVFLSGISVSAELMRISFSGGNFILVLLGGIWLFIDGILNYIGPVLFLWGSTKLFIQGSLKFQELTARAARLLGDIGTLATRNVRRRPARSAAIAFLIALIVGFGVQVNGQLASERDYARRQAYYSVGADATATVANVSEAQVIMDDIVANVSGIENATIEYTLSPQQSDMTLKAIDPQVWLETAYYEAEWFSGASVNKAFSELAADNNTIILERRVARSFNLTLGEVISLDFKNATKPLRVVGFFGPEPVSQTGTFPAYESPYWSFIPTGLYDEIVNFTDASARIVLKLNAGEDGKSVAQNIRNLHADISYVDSFAERWEEAQINASTMGTLEVQQLGIVFAVLAASVGTALISVVTMKERNREAIILSVRGLSYKQLVVMFLTENLALVTFSVVLGVVVGLITVYGAVTSSNALISGLVSRHLFFSMDATLMVIEYIVLIFASIILPIVIMSRRYVTKREGMVRLR